MTFTLQQKRNVMIEDMCMMIGLNFISFQDIICLYHQPNLCIMGIGYHDARYIENFIFFMG